MLTKKSFEQFNDFRKPSDKSYIALVLKDSTELYGDFLFAFDDCVSIGMKRRHMAIEINEHLVPYTEIARFRITEEL